MNEQPTNPEIVKTLEAHLPKEEHSKVWEALTTPLAVADEKPIQMGDLWKTLTTVVTADKMHSMWIDLNRPVAWPFKD